MSDFKSLGHFFPHVYWHYAAGFVRLPIFQEAYSILIYLSMKRSEEAAGIPKSSQKHDSVVKRFALVRQKQGSSSYFLLPCPRKLVLITYSWVHEHMSASGVRVLWGACWGTVLQGHPKVNGQCKQCCTARQHQDTGPRALFQHGFYPQLFLQKFQCLYWIMCSGDGVLEICSKELHTDFWSQWCQRDRKQVTQVNICSPGVTTVLN